MESTLKKKILFLICTIFFTTNLFSLPGVIQKIPDESGVFAYYKDSSFNRESYFGIIFYNESSLGVRYFAPEIKNQENFLPEKDISILFSINPEKDFIELTGERILTSITPEDTNLVNYLHDMIYELNSRRKNAGFIENTKTLTQDYEQFGGKVQIEFDSLIPIFSIKKISSANGKVLFNLVTTGKLNSSQDKSFSSFKGLPKNIKDDSHSFKNKKSKKQNISFSKENNISQKIKLDSQWTQNAENFFTLENVAILAFDSIDFSAIFDSKTKNQYFNKLLQNFTFGKDQTFPYSELLTIKNKNNSTIAINLFFNNESKSFTKDFKILTKVDENNYGILTLTVFQNAYSRNSKYFDEIIKSYKIEKIKN